MDNIKPFFEADLNNNYFGFYEGVVEDNADPWQMGRLRIRDLGRHSDPKSIKTEDIEWAEPCFMFGGPDFGSIIIPPVGSFVYFSYLYGSQYRKLWFGSRYSILNTNKHVYLRNPAKNYPPYPINMSPKPDIVWNPERGPEAPKEYLRMVNLIPDRLVLIKSPKGASIDIEERDNHERFNFHDRLGQTIYLEGNVKSEYGTDLTPGNEQNHAQRDLRSGNDGSQLPLESTYLGEASINLIDLSGQFITLNTDGGDNSIKLVSKECYKDESGIIASNKELPGVSSVNLELSASDQSFILEVRNKNELKGKIRIDGLTGNIEIETLNTINLKAKTISINGNVDINGNLSVNKSILTPNYNLYNL